MMASTLKRRGIATLNRPPAKRRKIAQNRDRSSTPEAEAGEPPGYPLEEWPLKRILGEGKKQYLVVWADHPRSGKTYDPEWVDKKQVGIAAIEEWEAEKRQREQRPDSARPRQKKHSRGPHSHKRGEVALRTGRLSSPATAYEEQDTPRVRRQRYSKKRAILSSSPPIEIPETQQEVLPNHNSIAVVVNRPIDFLSQDYPIATDSQVERNLGTQDTAASKGNSEEDSTLGSSIPPDSPTQSPAGHSTIQESPSQVLLSYPSAGSRPQNNGAGGVSISGKSLSSGVESSHVGQHIQSVPQDLLVVQSDPIGETDIVRSQLAEHPAEHINSSSPPSPLFFSDEGDLDLKTVADTNRVEEESGAEGELEVLPEFSSSIGSGNQNAVRRRGSRPRPSSAVSSARLEQPQRGSQFSPAILNTPPAQAEPKEAPELVRDPTKFVRRNSARRVATRSIQSSTPVSSARFHSQLSLPDARAAQIESPRATSRLKTTHKLSVTVPRPSQVPAAQSSSESFLQSTSSAGRTPRPIPFLRHPASSPQDSVLSSESNHSPIQADMANSHRESPPRVRRRPSSPSEMTPELGLREKLRQIRATSRANDIARTRNQANTGDPRSLIAMALETRSVRRLSPGKRTQSLATISTSAEDQPIPSLENVDRPIAEMEVDRVDVEPAPSSSLAPPPPVLYVASEKITMPMEDHEVEKAMPELDIPTMPLLQPSEFVVPLPVDGRIKHQYLAVLKEKYEDTSNFLNSPRSPRLIGNMVHMIRQLNDTVVHTDLGLEGPATQIASTNEEALWAEDASSKFAFLGRIISILRGSNHHIVVVARCGTTQDILRSYLEGKRVTYRQHSGADSVENLQEGDRENRMRYTLLATNQDSLKSIPRSASLILAFDDSFEASMLPDWCSTTRFVPVLLLLVVNSAEHVGRCIPQDIPQPERLRRLVKAVVHVQDDLGEMALQLDLRHAFNLDPGARLALVKKDLGAKIAHAAGQIAEALQSKNFALHFALPPISELDLSGLEDHPPSTEESKEASSGSSSGTPAGQKRLRDDRSSSAVQAKRQRLTPLRDTTHISDSIKNSQSQIDELKIALKRSHQEAAEERKERLKAEESVVYSQDRLKAIQQSLGGLQHRYETRTKQIHELQNEKQKIVQEREASDQRLEKLQTDNIALKDQRLQLQEELQAARNALQHNTIPGIAELEAAHSAARTATSESAGLRTSLTNLRRDFEFTRSQYQDASTKAADLASQVSDLESQNLDLNRQASDERRRLAELNYRGDRKRDVARIEELELELGNREAVLTRVEEEVKALRKGRGVTTRGSSMQPRDVGMGGASPRNGGNGSRAGSPALGGTVGGNHGLVGGRASALRNER